MTGAAITVSHGRDFFGIETVPVKVVRELGEYVRGILPAAGPERLARLLETADEAERRIDSDEAALLAVLLRRTVASNRLQKKYAEIAARLGNAVANSAADAKPWTWTLPDGETGS